MLDAIAEIHKACMHHITGVKSQEVVEPAAQHGSKRMRMRKIRNGASNGVLESRRFDGTLNEFFSNGNAFIDGS